MGALNLQVHSDEIDLKNFLGFHKFKRKGSTFLQIWAAAELEQLLLKERGAPTKFKVFGEMSFAS